MAATLSQLEQQNPNIRSQIQEWQSARTNNGQSPMDWDAFRQHAMAIGAPDPGPEAPQEFMQAASTASSSPMGGSSMGGSFGSPMGGSSMGGSSMGGSFAGQQSQQSQDPALLEAIRIRDEYEADKNTPTDKWLKARGMTQAQLDAALKLAGRA
jgi:hypothetical protein